VALAGTLRRGRARVTVFFVAVDAVERFSVLFLALGAALAVVRVPAFCSPLVSGNFFLALGLLLGRVAPPLVPPFDAEATDRPLFMSLGRGLEVTSRPTAFAGAALGFS
jgi:hypothetical protein